MVLPSGVYPNSAETRALAMAKTEFLQIRCTPEDRDRLEQVAEAEHLDLSTWARRVLLQAVERWEKRRPALRVAERDAAYRSRPRTPRKG